MKIWVLALASAAGLGLAAEEAFAERSRHGSSSAHQGRQHQPRAQHENRQHQPRVRDGHRQHQPRAEHGHRGHHPRAEHSHRERSHHAYPHRHHQYHHHHARPPRVVVVPAFSGYYHAPAPVVVAPVAVHPLNGGGYWYFCPGSQAYYPYVLECPSGWVAVVPN